MISCQMRIKQRFGNFLKPVQNKDMKQGLKKGMFQEVASFSPEYRSARPQNYLYLT